VAAYRKLLQAKNAIMDRLT